MLFRHLYPWRSVKGSEEKILLDVTPLQTDHGRRGIGAYARGLLAGLDAIGLTFGTWGIDRIVPELSSLPDVTLPLRSAPRGGGTRTALALGLAAALSGSQVGGPLHFLSPSTALVRHRGPRIETAYDLVPRLFPDSYLRSPVHRFLWRRYEQRLRTAAAVVADSAHTADHVADLVGVDRHRIVVAYPACPDLPAPRRDRPLSDPYVLVAGNAEPHKNVELALAAIASSGHVGRLRVIVTGTAGGDDRWRRLREQADRWAVRLETLGHVAPQILSDLYGHAEVVLFPSLAEGFGLPALEAMRAGAPVVVTDRGALPEVVGKHAVVVAPDVERWCTALEDVLDGAHPDLEAARQHALSFTPGVTAEAVLRAWETAGAQASSA